MLTVVLLTALAFARLNFVGGHTRGVTIIDTPSSDQLTKPKKADGTVIRAAVGEVVSVDLPSTPSTGYEWVLPALPDGAELVDTSFAPPPAGTFGEGGVQHFHVRASRPGKYALTFQLKRSWEAESTDTTVVELNVE